MKINYRSLKKADKGIVYILYLDIEYKDTIYNITKIGVTTRDVEARVAEILISIWKITRVFPRCYVKRFRTVDYPYKLETKLLDLYKDRIDIGVKFSGSTECIELDDKSREELISTYESYIDNDNYK